MAGLNQSPLDDQWNNRPEQVWTPEEVYGPMPAPPWADMPPLAAPARAALPPATRPAPPPAAPPTPATSAVQLDRLGRNPADVRAMLTERARQQYERRFGAHAPGKDTASLASQGQGVDGLIRRLAGVPQIGLPTPAQFNRMDNMRR